MKKILTIIAAAVFSVSSIFAENAIHLGGSIPSGSFTTDAEGVDLDMSTSGFVFAFDYTHIADAGFTWKIGFDAGSISGDYDVAKNVDFEGAFFDSEIGFGYSFIHNEKMTLSLTGNLGFDFFTLTTDVSFVGDSATLLFHIGPEVSFTYKFLSHFGVFGNLGLYYATGSTTGDSIDDSYSTSGVIFKPKFGIAIPF